jgi:hypothetical protein
MAGLCENNTYNDSMNFVELVSSYNGIEVNEEENMRKCGISSTMYSFINDTYGSLRNFNTHQTTSENTTVNGFTRIVKLRKGLAALDRSGWDRSYHQRIFHVS